MYLFTIELSFDCFWSRNTTSLGVNFDMISDVHLQPFKIMDSRDENAGGITEVASDQLPVTDSPFKRRKKSMVTLRELGTSDRYFWRDSLAEQLSQTVGDKGSDGNIRRLPGNEVTVMTLNEIAVRRGRGFFFHLRERRGWRSHSNEELNPQSRDPPPPGYVDVTPCASVTS